MKLVKRKKILNIKKKNVIILGGTGFIGKNLAKFLNKKYNVIIISKTKKKIDLNNIKIIKTDLTEKRNVRKVFKKFNDFYIVNCSGYINHENLKKYQVSNIIKSHYEIVKNIFENVDTRKIRKFIQLGSSDEYGSNYSPLNENLREYPFSTYSFSKVASTHFLQMVNKTLNVETIILRLFLIYGPGQDFKRFIPQIIKGCLMNKKFPASKGIQRRDFLYIKDLCEAIKTCIDLKKNIGGEIFNLGSGKPIAIKTMINRIKKIIGAGHPNFGKVKFRIGESMRLYPNIKKAKKILKWKPKVSLTTGLKKTIEYYKNIKG